MPRTICPQCRTREVVTGRYVCRPCEDQMTGRAHREPPPPSNKPNAPDGAESKGRASGDAASASARCRHCGESVEAGDVFCAACGGHRAAGGTPRTDPLCQICGAPLSPEDAFCASCGAEKGRSDTGGSASRNRHGGSGASASGRHSRPSAGEQAAPRQPQGSAASAVQSVVSKRWFWPAWNGLSAMWSLALIAMALCGVWMVICAAVHYYRGAGMNGVYVAEDGAGDMTFWSDGTYLMSAYGINLPGKYRIRSNGTVDMTAQGDSVSNASQQADPIVSLMARGLDGEVSSDRNTFRWQGITYSYDHKPTTGPPAVPDPSATETTTPSGAAPPSQMHTPTPQEINQSLAKPGDEFHVDTDPAPSITDPNQIGTSPADKNEWDPSGPKMQRYYAAHPNMAPAPAGAGQAALGTAPAAPTGADPNYTDSKAAPTDPAPNYAPPPGMIMPDNNIQDELKRVK